MNEIDSAAALARDIAPELEAVLLTHYSDADTLDTLRPGETDLETVTAVNRAVAEALAEEGVEVVLQKADRAAFRRWMQGRDDTPETRRRWVDRSAWLRGETAFRLLGLEAPEAEPPAKYGAAPGPVADRLVAAFIDADDAALDELAQGLLGAERNDVLELALRKVAERHGDDTAAALEVMLLAAAEGGAFGPSGWAELVALPVALPVRDVPDAEEMGTSLVAAGVVADEVELRFLPGWRSPDALSALSPGALRRVLLDVVAGAEPRELPPGDTDDLAAHGFGVLLGVQVDWNIAIWDRIAAGDDEGDEDAGEARRAELFDAWRAAAFEAHAGCVPLALVPPSEAAGEIEAFLDEAGRHTDGIDTIRDFVAMARREAGGDEVVCRAEVIGEGLELSLYTESGLFLDSLTLPAERLPARAEEMVRLIGSFVRVVRDAPGR